MSDLFEIEGLTEMSEPPAPTHAITATEIQHGPSIPPQQRVLLYSSNEWESFIHEWVHYVLKKDYAQVQRMSGPHDMGIDVAGFMNPKRLEGDWDNYQCKHYKDPLSPTDVWVELGKILWYSYNRSYSAPRAYWFVAPKGVGTKLARFLGNQEELKRELIENWDKYVSVNITDKEAVLLTGPFKTYVDNFDFSIFGSKSILDILEGFRATPIFAARFGGGLPLRPEPGDPPREIGLNESTYISELLSAYKEHTKGEVFDIPTLSKIKKLDNHFKRQRESFYNAEMLRVFARDNVPPGTFESHQTDVYDGIIDVCDAEHEDGFARVCEVIQAANQLQLTSNPLIASERPKDRIGICHQLANDERLKWTR